MIMCPPVTMETELELYTLRVHVSLDEGTFSPTMKHWQRAGPRHILI